LQRIKEEAERAKIALSSTTEYEINLPFITADATGPKHIQMKLTRAKLEQLCDNLFERLIPPVMACLKDAGLRPEDIDDLVLVGGMTRMPKIVEIAQRIIGKKPHQGVNPDEVVALGAAIQGGVLKGQVRDVLLLDVTAAILGNRNTGWGIHQDHRKEHYDPDSQVGNLLNGYRQSNKRRNSCLAR